MSNKERFTRRAFDSGKRRVLAKIERAKRAVYDPYGVSREIHRSLTDDGKRAVDKAMKESDDGFKSGVTGLAMLAAGAIIVAAALPVILPKSIPPVNRSIVNAMCPASPDALKGHNIIATHQTMIRNGKGEVVIAGADNVISTNSADGTIKVDSSGEIRRGEILNTVDGPVTVYDVTPKPATLALSKIDTCMDATVFEDNVKVPGLAP